MTVLNDGAEGSRPHPPGAGGRGVILFMGWLSTWTDRDQIGQGGGFAWAQPYPVGWGHDIGMTEGHQ